MSEKAIFLDRDDTLIEDPGYISDPEQVKLLDGVGEALIELRRMGYKLIVVSNQSGVARGIVTEEVLAKIHERLEDLLGQTGAKLDKIYYCPFHPEGAVRKYRKDSDRRKPSPGMITAAAEEMDVDLSLSWAVGNSLRDIEAGQSAGCKTILICDPSHARTLEPGSTKPDYEAVNMREVVNIIKKQKRNPQQLETVTSAREPANSTADSPMQAPLDTDELAGTPLLPSEQLLRDILEQLKKNQRTEMFGEFSLMRFSAGIAQTGVFACLVLAVGFLLSPADRTNAVITTLVFALIFQVMALTFLVMRGQK